MSDAGKANRVVVLRFADGVRVDIAADMSEAEAIADMVSRAIASAHPPTLPLYEAITAVIPRERLLVLLNGAAGPAGVVTIAPEAEPSPVPIAGIQAAMRAYGGKVISGAAPDIVAEAQRQLAAFFDRYGVRIVAGDGRPEWLPQLPRTPAEAWIKP